MSWSDDGRLVFAGNGAGEELRAYDAKNGTQLWSYKAQTAVYAGPITYELDGEQYIAQSVGGVAQGGYFAPGYARMLVFKIGGTATLPANQPYTPPPLNPPPSTASAEVIKAGEDKYNQYCSVCHGADGVQQRGTFPSGVDLSTVEKTANIAVIRAETIYTYQTPFGQIFPDAFVFKKQMDMRPRGGVAVVLLD